jgi:hypothetical protein
VGIFRPGKPVVLASLTADKAVLAGNSFVVWDQAEEDPPGQWIGSEITVERSGKYLITAGAGRGLATVSSSFIVRIKVNQISVATVSMPPSTGLTMGSLSRFLSLVAGDVVQLEVNPTSAGLMTLAFRNTYLSVVRLGPKKWT